MHALTLSSLFVLPVVAANPPDSKRIGAYLKAVCDIGPRISGTAGMIKQRELLTTHFAKFSAKTSWQVFDARHPLTGKPVRMANLVVTWNAKARKRILICCHYDTRPWPDKDRQNPRGKFIGANDGGSGVAVLMELAHHMAAAQKAIGAEAGVDFVFFDGEELVYNERRDAYFLGSTHFARQYRADIRNRKIQHRYIAGVLLDMVGGKNVRFKQERYSLRFAPKVTRSLFASAKAISAKEFIARPGVFARDDHLPLNQIARIPTCDLIDTDFPLWHTTQDVPENCSPEVMATVTEVLLHWLSKSAFGKR